MAELNTLPLSSASADIFDDYERKYTSSPVPEDKHTSEQENQLDDTASADSDTGN
jgi:hypothetical protein